RPPVNAEGDTALAALTAAHGGSANRVQLIAGILLRIEREYDALSWPTLLALANADQLAPFLQGLVDAAPATNTPATVVTVGTELNLDANLLNQWSSLVA
ncbi:MAG: hypothetical protein KDI47_15205, partial [Gammaproteobacteria bacterium]|nr:hypothetical protein [Gammaproteobacteria bacterium]